MPLKAVKFKPNCVTVKRNGGVGAGWDMTGKNNAEYVEQDIGSESQNISAQC